MRTNRRAIGTSLGRCVGGSVFILGTLVGTAGCVTSENKCGSSPVLRATWAGHSTPLYRCGGVFGGMPTTSPADNVSGGVGVDIQMSVGQQLTITKESGWNGHAISQPLTDNPGVLKLTHASSGEVVSVFTAITPGIADIGAHSDVCGDASGGCWLGVVQVDP